MEERRLVDLTYSVYPSSEDARIQKTQHYLIRRMKNEDRTIETETEELSEITIISLFFIFDRLLTSPIAPEVWHSTALEMRKSAKLSEIESLRSEYEDHTSYPDIHDWEPLKKVIGEMFKPLLGEKKDTEYKYFEIKKIKEYRGKMNEGVFAKENLFVERRTDMSKIEELLTYTGEVRYLEKTKTESTWNESLLDYKKGKHFPKNETNNKKSWC